MDIDRRGLIRLGLGAALGAGATLSGWSARAAVPRIAQRVANPAFTPDVELSLTAGAGEASILPGTPTRVWRFSGRVIKGPASALQTIPDSYLGPVIRLKRGQKVRIRFTNGLEEPSIVHWHGLDVPDTADGHPRLAVPAGGEYVYEFEVVNRAGTYWYHPHPHMRTGAQVNQGLAGLLIVSDDEEAAAALPAGPQELLCVLQDRRFDAQNQIVYSPGMMEQEIGFLGDRVLVNGRERPSIAVGRRAYRMRLLNGSSARVYKLAWKDGTPLAVVGTDGGLLERATTVPFLTLAPAQRADLIVDLSGRPTGTRLELVSIEYPNRDVGMTMGMAARPLQGTPFTILTLEVSRGDTGPFRMPDRLSTFSASWRVKNDAPVRTVPISFRAMQWFLAGRQFEMEGVAADETVAAGSTHVWEFVNTGGMMGTPMAHPIHLHGRQFRVIGRQNTPAASAVSAGIIDGGWMDTVLVLPGETVRIQVPFTEIPGLYLYHCHILEHEDMGMMRNFRVTARAASVDPQPA